MHRISHQWAGTLVFGLFALALSSPSPAQVDPPLSLPGNRTLIADVTFVAFDTETTGFDPVKDRIVEIGAAKFRNGEIIAQKSWLINPGRKIPYWARRVHGITDEMVADEREFKDVYPEFSAFIEGSVLMAHNARFDVAFLNGETRRNRLRPPPNEVLDTLALFRKWFPDSEKHSLEGLSSYLQLSRDEYHRALADSMHIFRILGIGLEAQAQIKTLGALEKSSGGTIRF